MASSCLGRAVRGDDACGVRGGEALALQRRLVLCRSPFLCAGAKVQQQ